MGTQREIRARQRQAARQQLRAQRRGVSSAAGTADLDPTSMSDIGQGRRLGEERTAQIRDLDSTSGR